MKEAIYGPESPLLRPFTLFQNMFSDLWLSRGLAWRLFVRDTSARYRQSILGYVWAIAPPIITTLTFVLLNKSGVFSIGETSIPYPAYIMIGTLLWQVFVDAINSPIKAVNAAKSMLAKINFPREALVLAGLLEVIFNFVIRLALLIAAFAFYQMVPSGTAVFSLIGVLAIILLGLMIGVLLTPVSVLYSDIGQALVMLLSLWMLFTPVVYVPPSTGLLATLSKVNPVSPLIVVTRDWLVGTPTSQFLPAACVFLATLVLLFSGWILYRLAMPIVIERMGG